MRTVNLNDLVCFRLTDAGALIVGRYMQAHGEDPIDTRFADGTGRMQVWRMMEVFGPHMSMCADPPFKDNAIEFLDWPSQDVEVVIDLADIKRRIAALETGEPESPADLAAAVVNAARTFIKGNQTGATAMERKRKLRSALRKLDAAAKRAA